MRSPDGCMVRRKLRPRDYARNSIVLMKPIGIVYTCLPRGRWDIPSTVRYFRPRFRRRRTSHAAGPEMKRYGQVLKLRPEYRDDYVRHHAAVWPGVLAQIRRSNIRNYSSY